MDFLTLGPPGAAPCSHAHFAHAWQSPHTSEFHAAWILTELMLRTSLHVTARPSLHLAFMLDVGDQSGHRHQATRAQCAWKQIICLTTPSCAMNHPWLHASIATRVVITTLAKLRSMPSCCSHASRNYGGAIAMREQRCTSRVRADTKWALLNPCLIARGVQSMSINHKWKGQSNTPAMWTIQQRFS